MTRINLFSIVCIICAAFYSLLAQDIDARVETLEARGRYTEALALFLRGADTSPVAQYYIGD